MEAIDTVLVESVKPLERKPHAQVRVEDEFGMADTGIFHPITAAKLPTHEEFAVVKLAEELGYTEALTIGALEDGIRLYQQRTAEMCIELGKRLLLLKEIVGHGEFLKRAEILGFSRSSAQRFMSTTKKAAKLPNLGNLIQKSGSQAKLLELLVLDSEDLEDIADGKDSALIALDDIEMMSATELRKALRIAKDHPVPEEIINQHQAELEAKTRELTAKESQLAINIKINQSLSDENASLEAMLDEARTKAKPGGDLISGEAGLIRTEAHAFAFGGKTYIENLRQLLNRTLRSNTLPDDEESLCVNAIGAALGDILLNAHQLYEEMQSLGDSHTFPPQLSGRNMLTLEEKEQLSHCKYIIEADIESKKATRAAGYDLDKKRQSGKTTQHK